jgi:predicted flap endonuclease-1-like 5' DNA nuclease
MAWQWQGKTYQTRAALEEAKRRYYAAVSARYRTQHLSKLRESEGARRAVAPPQPSPEAAPSPPTATVEPDKPDDLTRIRGIGAGIQYRLNRGEVYTFAQLARLRPEDIYELTGVSVEAVIRRRLIEQAEELAAEAGSSD